MTTDRILRAQLSIARSRVSDTRALVLTAAVCVGVFGLLGALALAGGMVSTGTMLSATAGLGVILALVNFPKLRKHRRALLLLQIEAEADMWMVGFEHIDRSDDD